jgi:ribonuclease R
MDKQTEKLIDKWIFHASKSGDLRLALANPERPDEEQRQSRKSKSGRRKKSAANAKAPAQREDHEALQFLLSNGIAMEDNRGVHLMLEFTGVLSAARSGVAFVPVGRGIEAVVPFADRGGALHRDKVNVILTGFNRGRFTARVNRIVEPFSGEYFARILAAARAGGSASQYLLAELIDLPDRPQVLVAGKHKAGDTLYLRRSEKRAQYLREMRGGSRSGGGDIHSGYGRTQALVFEASGRKVREDRKGDLERLRLRYMLPGDFDKKLIPTKKELTALVNSEMKNPERVKVTGSYIFTIDGEDAKDFDDAIACRKIPGGFELDVHIADVSFFVRPGTPLFDEALRRGNSYYLAGSVIPMLPEILSNEFCSLKPKTKRLAFTVRMHFDQKGKMTGYELFRSVIYINKRYTYKEAQKALGKKKSPLADAMELAELLIAHRNAQGRIDLNIAEQKAIYNKEGKFLGLEKQERLQSHRLVEECMLSANQAVANYALKHHLPILHRNHESMPIDKLERLNRYLEKYVARLKIRGTDQKEIARILGHEKLDPVREVFQFLLLRSFMQANYMPESKGHWGLAFSEYAHFTSPIRRFADLVTHLQLGAHLRREKTRLKLADLEYYGREASRLERIAFEAERADRKLLAVRALGGRVGESFSAWLSGFSQDKLFITLVEYPVEGEIDAGEVDRWGEIRMIDDFSVFAGKLQKTLSLGDRFKVTLVKADPLEMALKFTFSGK